MFDTLRNKRNAIPAALLASLLGAYTLSGCSWSNQETPAPSEEPSAEPTASTTPTEAPDETEEPEYTPEPQTKAERTAEAKLKKLCEADLNVRQDSGTPENGTLMDDCMAGRYDPQPPAYTRTVQLLTKAMCFDLGKRQGRYPSVVMGEYSDELETLRKTYDMSGKDTTDVQSYARTECREEIGPYTPPRG
jgi:hypothetical protein